MRGKTFRSVSRVPTGYTEDIYSGKDVSFADFAMKCARATHYLASMQDVSLNVPMPDHIEPNSHSAEELERLEEYAKRVMEWSNEQAKQEAQQAYGMWLEQYEATLAIYAARRRRYERLLARARAWEPPTRDHKTLRVFMIKELESGIELDCGRAYPAEPPVQLSGAEYKAQVLRSARRNLQFLTVSIEAEEERAKQDDEWLQALRQSLVDPL